MKTDWSKILMTIPIVIMFIAYCDNIKNWTSTRCVEYHFPEQSVITEVDDESCENGILDKIIKLGNQFDQDLFEPDLQEIDFKEIANDLLDYHVEMEHYFDFIEDNRTRRLRSILKKIAFHSVVGYDQTEIVLVTAPFDPTFQNAWACPDGKIYFTTALYDAMEFEDEIAFIIAHEVAHLDNFHLYKHIAREKQFIQQFGAENGEQLSHFYKSVLTAFFQWDEFEADRGAVYLTYAAGYNPERCLNFFQKLAEGEIEMGQFAPIKRFMLAHPNAKARFDCIHAYLFNARVEKPNCITR